MIKQHDYTISVGHICVHRISDSLFLISSAVFGFPNMAAGYMYFYFGKQHCVLMTVSDKMEGTFN
jgi:hypothetical protein